MNARKLLCTVFASFSLGAAGAAAAQEAPATPPTPAVETAALSDVDLNFNVRDFFIKNEAGEPYDSRAPMYLCADNTQSCWTQPQRDAWAVREFQLAVRTAVYTCQQYYPDEQLIDHYNNFVLNNQTTLQQNFHTVAAYFTSKTSTAREAMLAQDRLEIATGNVFSGASSPEYCERMVPVMRHVASLQNDADVVSVAHRLLLPRPSQPPAA